ncbi:DEAD/DEAH box helicase [Flaviflexus equikiangi]|uniref:RNA helicase n=1 Tax=Flaviflexus equikiangi TaxID=2758573 RepID=A0ABS2TIM5_9ACTO|nr:DEAD/DEAH box helicase [Flaviflexus equikiangi]MBM9433391.1 DEAD/DEAH box helicase [Flaviflexus equikiangi]
MADTPELNTPEEAHEELAHGFAELGLPDDLLDAVQKLGFTTPTAIQEQTIPALLGGRDVVGVAQTGTGKTAAFGLPLLAQIDPDKRRVQAIVLAPTRELAMQVADAISDFAAVSRDIKVVAVYGGSSYVPQIRALERGAQVVVGTPGRVMDLIDKGALDLSRVSYFVLDEADEMLRMGFAEDVDTIAGSLPTENRVTALFSATMPPQIRRVAEHHMHNPEHISVSNPRSVVSTVKQTFAVVPSRHKIGGLARVLATSEADAAIVFVRTRASAEELALELNARGVQAAALSGDVAQRDREKLVNRLREGFLDVLVATDVAARGLDVERIGLVINFDIPKEIDTYVHRIGRTGRAGREGVALSFVTPRERARLRKIEQATKANMEEVDLPTPAEVSKLRADKLLKQAIERHAAGRLSVYRETLAGFKAAQEAGETDMSVDDLVYALLALGVRDPGPQADDEPDRISVREDRGDRDRDDRDRPRRDRDRDRGSMSGARRYRVEVGHRDGVKPGAIVGAITGEGGLRGSDLGKIDIYPSFSLVEIVGELSTEATNRIYDAEVSGRALKIRPDDGPKRSGGGDRGGYRGDRGDRMGGGDRFKRGGDRFDKRRSGGPKRRRDY